LIYNDEIIVHFNEKTQGVFIRAFPPGSAPKQNGSISAVTAIILTESGGFEQQFLQGAEERCIIKSIL